VRGVECRLGRGWREAGGGVGGGEGGWVVGVGGGGSRVKGALQLLSKRHK